MKLPRDIGGMELAKKLQRFGYQVTRQTGSHIRLTTISVISVLRFDQRSLRILFASRRDRFRVFG